MGWKEGEWMAGTRMACKPPTPALSPESLGWEQRLVPAIAVNRDLLSGRAPRLSGSLPYREGAASYCRHLLPNSGSDTCAGMVGNGEGVLHCYIAGEPFYRQRVTAEPAWRLSKWMQRVCWALEPSIAERTLPGPLSQPSDVVTLSLYQFDILRWIFYIQWLSLCTLGTF